MGCAAALKDALGTHCHGTQPYTGGFKPTRSFFKQILPVYPSLWSVYFCHQQRMEGRAGALLAGAGAATGSVL